jgi:hypothetical protein
MLTPAQLERALANLIHLVDELAQLVQALMALLKRSS